MILNISVYNILQKTGDFIPLVKVILKNEQDIKRTASGETKEEQPEKSYVYFFPLRIMLKKVFELPNVFDDVTEYVKELQNDISNFIQSKLWKGKTKNFKSPNVLPLFEFSDDYETRNVLKSHAGDNKLCGTYLNIPCLPAAYKSTFSSIFHALLSYAKDREKYGYYALYRCLIEDLGFLNAKG